MDNTINLLILHQLVECIEVADVHLHELVVGVILNVSEVSEITCISKSIEVDDLILRIFVYEKSYDV